MSGTQVSSFAPENALFDLSKVYQAAQQYQQGQQTLGSNEIEMLARAAQGLLDPKLYPDEASRAAAYPQVVQQLRQSGFGKNAPEAYPGEAQLRRVAMMGTSSSKQAEWNYNTGVNQAGLTPTPAATGTTAGTTTPTPSPAPSGPGYAPSGTGTPYVAPNLPQGVTAEEDQAVRTVIGEAGGEGTMGQAAVAHVIKNRATQSGKSVSDVVFAPNQFEPWNNPTTRARLEAIDPTSPQYQTILNNVVRPTFAGQSQDPTGGATHFYSPTAQAQLGREPPSWAANQTPAVIGRHNFYNIGYRAPGGGTTQTQTTAAADTGPVILGDSLASPQGLGGQGVVGAKPGQVLEQIQTAAKDGRLKGRDVVISSGASNAPSEVALVEEQIKEAKKGGARSVTVTGVGTRPDIVGSNQIIQQIAEKNGARFVPVNPATLSGDQVHPENYGPLKQAVGAVTAAPGGVAARTGGVDVAGPGGVPASVPGAPVAAPPNALAPGAPGAPAAAPAAPAAQPTAAAPPPSRQLALDDQNLTADDRRTLAGMVRESPADFNRARTAMQARNIQQQHQAFEDRRQVAADAATQAERDYQHLRNAGADQRSIDEAGRQAQAARLAEEKAARERDAAADPIQGTSDTANANRLLLRYVDKILDGSATPAERRLYAEAAQHYLKPQMQWIDDPSDPTKKQMVQAPGQLPEGFPHPSFKPGEQPEQKPAVATKTDFKPLPETERKLLIDTATRIDQETQQRNTFKPEYAGFGNAAIGEFANAVARNNPIASKADTARAEWWQNYQRYKLSVRQGISGQSLTASELGEFDKADVHPGMTAQAVRDNLLQQDKILRTAHERRVGSLAADRYSPDAIRSASGVDPSKVTARPLTESIAPKPDVAPHPPGYQVIIP